MRPDQMFVVLTKPHQRFYADQVDEFPEVRGLIQPDNFGTAPAILYSISRLCHLDPSGVVAFFPSDRAGADLMPLNDLYNRIPNVNVSDMELRFGRRKCYCVCVTFPRS